MLKLVKAKVIGSGGKYRDLMPRKENVVNVKVKKQYSRDRQAGWTPKFKSHPFILQKLNKIVNFANKSVPLEV